MNLALGVLRGRYPARAAALVSGETHLDREALAISVARAAGGFRALGVLPGEPVLLIMRNSLELAVAWLGAVHAGAVAVAVSGRLAEADYRHILSDSGARYALVDESFVEARKVFVASAVALPAGETVAAFDADADTPAFCLYSSGTTGRPKAVLHAHRAGSVVGEAFRMLGLSVGDAVLTTSRFSFAYGLEHGLLAPLAYGVTSVLIPDWPDAASVLTAVEKHRPRALFSVPTMYRRLIAEPAERLGALREVRYFVSAGERLSPELVKRWRDATGGELLNLYGMSETFCACMMTPPGTSDGLRTGTPFPSAEVRLEAGVLWVRHPALARAYASAPNETAAQFRDGWFCSRDIFVRDAQGYYIHQGRSDELVKIAGQWVWPTELEEAALSAAAVSEAACVAVADGDGLHRLALFVTARGADDAALAAARACEELPRHKRPKWVRVVAELPRTPTGKVQRYRLREMLERELRPSG
jgi:3-hydroxybenzoate/4-hydroxybenzoate---CoA ligase